MDSTSKKSLAGLGPFRLCLISLVLLTVLNSTRIWRVTKSSTVIQKDIASSVLFTILLEDSDHSQTTAKRPQQALAETVTRETLILEPNCSLSNCPLSNLPQKHWRSQAGQDKYVWERIFSHQPELWCDRNLSRGHDKGVFVEFGARNGIEHSNTYVFEKYLGWKGLLFEIDPVEFKNLTHNRPGAHVTIGAVCPRGLDHITVLFSRLGGWTGSVQSYEPKRAAQTRQIRDERNVTCYALDEQLRKHGMHRVDYMTIDTEGSELDIVLDFPWNDFDVRVVQIEQLDARQFPYQEGKMTKIINHMTSFGYKLLSVYEVARFDTHDIIFVRNLDDVLKSGASHPRDGGQNVDNLLKKVNKTQ